MVRFHFYHLLLTSLVTAASCLPAGFVRQPQGHGGGALLLGGDHLQSSGGNPYIPDNNQCFPVQHSGTLKFLVGSPPQVQLLTGSMSAP
jgi:hypothetical protein